MKKIIEKCFLDLVREFEELKEGQSESEGGGDNHTIFSGND